MEVVEDIRGRCYGYVPPVADGWTERPAELTRAYLGPAIDELVAAYD